MFVFKEPPCMLDPQSTKEIFKNWNYELKDLTPEEVAISKAGENIKYKESILSYLRLRKICFPDKESFNGIPVEIENFVYEHKSRSEDGIKNIQNKLCIYVLDDKEYYYGAFLENTKKEDVSSHGLPSSSCDSSNIFPIGSRDALDIYIDALTKKLGFGGKLKVTHNRIFKEKVEFFEGRLKIIRQKMESPESIIVRIDPHYGIANDEDIES